LSFPVSPLPAKAEIGKRDRHPKCRLENFEVQSKNGSIEKPPLEPSIVSTLEKLSDFSSVES